MAEIKHADYRIRKLIGILGLSLPIVLPMLFKWDVISSMSHYYYVTASSLFLIIVLSSLGLFLISYKGYDKNTTEEKEIINDDWLTNIAGLAALLIVLIPTACDGSGSTTIDAICEDHLPLFGHLDNTTDTIHLIVSGIFVVLMGWMSFFKFTLGQDKKGWEYKLYRICGLITWLAVVLLVIYFNLNIQIQNFVFWMEVLALVPFGISWLIKGKSIEAIKQII